MKLLYVGKDGGYESTVTGYWLVESKRFGSIVLLRFDNGSREAFHSHAFHALSWVLSGKLIEHLMFASGPRQREYQPSARPVVTKRTTFHKVVSVGRTWVLSFRGPWRTEWEEYSPAEQRFITLTHGRREVATNAN